MVLVSSFSLSGIYLKRLIIPCLQITSITNHTHCLHLLLAPTRSTQYMQLRDRGHSCALPTCTLQLYKNSFIDRCLFEYTVWWSDDLRFTLCVKWTVHVFFLILFSIVLYAFVYILLRDIWFDFYPRDAMLARVIEIATCLSVCLSVTRRYCVKTKKASGVISSPSGSPKTLVFWRQVSSPNSKGFPPNGGPK